MDRRMAKEMLDGKTASTTREIIAANAGGPYGSIGGILRGVQADSQRVWETVGEAFPDWYKAQVHIEGRDDGVWEAVARKDGVVCGERFCFPDRS